MTPTWYVPRRTILRAMGTGVALPFLEAMAAPGRARAAIDPRTNPRRLVGIWGLPSGGAGKEDPRQGCMVSPWTPDDEGPLTAPDANGFLDPFFGKGAALGSNVKGLPFRDVSSKLTILTGLSDASGSHVINAAMLGPRQVACPVVGKQYTDIDASCNNTAMPDVGGPTIDQIAAGYFKKTVGTAVDSLVLGALESYPSSIRYIYGCNMSWKSATEHVNRDVDPAAVFDKLFSGTVDPREDKAVAELRRKNRTSVLDAVRDQATGIKARLGKQDQAKISQYFDGVRDLETLIARGDVALSCVRPDKPAADRAGGYDKLDLRVKVLTDLVVKAFECDRTRVATLMYSNDNGGVWPFLGLDKDHHTMSHWQAPVGATSAEAKAYLDKHSKYALQMMAYFMAELDKRMDADGNTLLDNSVVLMSGDFCDGSHTWASANIVLGGRGGRDPATGNWALRAGRHVRCSPPWDFCTGAYPEQYCHTPNPTMDNTIYYPCTEALRFKGERTTKDLLWGMLQAIGIPDDLITGGKPTFGYATAPLDLTFPGKP